MSKPAFVLPRSQRLQHTPSSNNNLDTWGPIMETDTNFESSESVIGWEIIAKQCDSSFLMAESSPEREYRFGEI